MWQLLTFQFIFRSAGFQKGEITNDVFEADFNGLDVYCALLSDKMPHLWKVEIYFQFALTLDNIRVQLLINKRDMINGISLNDSGLYVITHKFIGKYLNVLYFNIYICSVLNNYSYVTTLIYSGIIIFLNILIN